MNEKKNFATKNTISKCSISDDLELKKSLKREAKIAESNYDEIKEKSKKNQKDVEMENELKSKLFQDQENCVIKKLKKLFSGEYRSEEFLKLPKKEQIDWLKDFIKSEEDGGPNNLKNLPDNLIELIIASLFEGDSGNSVDTKPDWLDLEKFKRGQKFAMDHFFGLIYSELLSLFILYSFPEELKILIITGNSSTPYKAFKRYVSIIKRLRNWFTEDPWKKGTVAYKDIQVVRKMHAIVRKRLEDCTYEEFDEATRIENPFCPTREVIFQDFQSSCTAPIVGQCPYKFKACPEFRSEIPKKLNQGDMATTQFEFLGLMILYPEYFGAHNATSDDLDDFCHTWRGLGYLLGIDENFNLCRGSLEEIKQRCKDFLEFWVKPNFRDFRPEHEHMFRCFIESVEYYIPGTDYESTVLYLAEMMKLETPRLYSSMTYSSWTRYILIKYYLQYGCQVPGMKKIMNKIFNLFLNRALNYSAEKHEEMKKRSEEFFKKAINNL